MHDPFPFRCPTFLSTKIALPLAKYFNLSTLPDHIHEVIFAILLYQFVLAILSPFLSTLFFRKTYTSLSPRTRLNWDVHIVGLFQSLVICPLGLYVVFADQESRRHKDLAGRIWGYTGAEGLVAAMACGYFLWDLGISLIHRNVFGWGMLIHAVCASGVYGVGFRPFIFFYAPIFVLYELSSPFVNLHWVLDKLEMTGGWLQWINGIITLVTFFLARVVWGNYQSCLLTWDIYRAYKAGSLNNALSLYSNGRDKGDLSEFRYSRDGSLPLWLAAIFLTSNWTLNVLNLYWMNKMVQTLRKRFPPPFGTKAIAEKKDMAISPQDLSEAVKELDDKPLASGVETPKSHARHVKRQRSN